jgi:hypothetical protein
MTLPELLALVEKAPANANDRILVQRNVLAALVRVAMAARDHVDYDTFHYQEKCNAALRALDAALGGKS